MSTVPFDPDKEYQVDRWPAAVAIVACVALYVALPDSLVIKPHWLVPALVLALLIPLLTHRHRHPEEPKWTRPVAITVLALITVANILSVAFLIHRQFWHPAATLNDGRSLFFSAILIWVTNVIAFGLWYWELDRGGPSVRGSKLERWPDFQFPQMENPQLVEPDWHPSFYDYLYLAFTDASAFSPTDAMPLSRVAKALMTVESGISMVTIIVVAARAINILH